MAILLQYLFENTLDGLQRVSKEADSTGDFCDKQNYSVETNFA